MHELPYKLHHQTRKLREAAPCASVRIRLIKHLGMNRKEDDSKVFKAAARKNSFELANSSTKFSRDTDGSESYRREDSSVARLYYPWRHQEDEGAATDELMRVLSKTKKRQAHARSKLVG